MTSRTTNPNTELRRINKQLTELRSRQRTLIGKVDGTNETVLLDALDLAEDVTSFCAKVDGDPSDTDRRHLIALNKRLNRMTGKVNKLPSSEAKVAAVEALGDAVQRIVTGVVG